LGDLLSSFLGVSNSTGISGDELLSKASDAIFNSSGSGSSFFEEIIKDLLGSAKDGVSSLLGNIVNEFVNALFDGTSGSSSSTSTSKGSSSSSLFGGSSGSSSSGKKCCCSPASKKRKAKKRALKKKIKRSIKSAIKKRQELTDSQYIDYV